MWNTQQVCTICMSDTNQSMRIICLGKLQLGFEVWVIIGKLLHIRPYEIKIRVFEGVLKTKNTTLYLINFFLFSKAQEFRKSLIEKKLIQEIYFFFEFCETERVIFPKRNEKSQLKKIDFWSFFYHFNNRFL